MFALDISPEIYNLSIPNWVRNAIFKDFSSRKNTPPPPERKRLKTTPLPQAIFSIDSIFRSILHPTCDSFQTGTSTIWSKGISSWETVASAVLSKSWGGPRWMERRASYFGRACMDWSGVWENIEFWTTIVPLIASPRPLLFNEHEKERKKRKKLLNALFNGFLTYQRIFTFHFGGDDAGRRVRYLAVHGLARRTRDRTFNFVPPFFHLLPAPPSICWWKYKKKKDKIWTLFQWFLYVLFSFSKR